MTRRIAVLAAGIASPAVAAGRAIAPNDRLAMRRISERQRDWILKPDTSLFWYRQVLEWVRDHL